MAGNPHPVAGWQPGQSGNPGGRPKALGLGVRNFYVPQRS